MAEVVVQTKRCYTCKDTKPADCFYRHSRSKDGLQDECKSCNKARSLTKAGRERSRKSSRKYMRSPRGRKKNSDYAKTEKHRKWLKEYREAKVFRTARSRAWGVIGSAVYTGSMPSARTLKCVRCDKQARHYHHHLGYAPEHQRDVIPVCALCHKQLDPAPRGYKRGSKSQK